MMNQPAFETSQESDDFNSKLHAMLNDPRLKEWADATALHSESHDAVNTLLKAQCSFDHYLDALANLGE